MALTTTTDVLVRVIEKRILTEKDPVEKARLIRELEALTAKETRG